jgi:hypothetical protein
MSRSFIAGFGQSRQCNQLAHPLHSRSGWIATPGFSRRNVVHNAGAPCHPSTPAYCDVGCNSNPATKDDKILKRDASTETRLCGDNTMASNDYVVADLTQIVDLRRLSDDSVPYATTINRRPGTDLDVVMDDYPSGLGNFLLCGTGNVTKAVLPDTASGMDHDALAYKRMHDRTSRADRAIAADQYVRSDYGRCGDDASRSNLSPRPDHSSWINRYSAPKARSWMNG